ncbi:MAG: NTP transferase domain-containing protein [Actinomycetota bacterium]|nr:NTP transferase domain-containing protein [Actinomycetota bacterium]
MDQATPGANRRVAIVVAGGSARRMGGVDKLALEVGGRTLLDRVLDAVGPLCDEVVVVGPTRPTSVKATVFTTEEAPGGGPVPAVAAGLAAVGAAGDVAVLAGDLPMLTTRDLDVLFAILADPVVEAAAAVDDRGSRHPLLAVHRGPGIRARIDGLGPLVGLPASHLLPPATVSVHLGVGATLNVNDPADLERARALIEARQ